MNTTTLFTKAFGIPNDTQTERACQVARNNSPLCDLSIPSYSAYPPIWAALTPLTTLQKWHTIFRENCLLSLETRGEYLSVFSAWSFPAVKKENPYASSCKLSLRPYCTYLACRRCF